MSIEIIKNETPPLKEVQMICDTGIHSKLNAFPITQCLNKHNFTLFLGKSGSGKTSLLTGLLKTPECFYKAYHRIYVFMPAASRSSLKDNFFETHIKEDQLFDGLEYEDLEQVYYKCMDDAEENRFSLIVLDDVQSALKDKHIAKLLLHMVNNRRHARLSIWMACQTYHSIPKQVRQGLTGLFVFKISKTEMFNIIQEQMEYSNDIIEKIQPLVFTKPHDFMFIDTNNRRIFSNWNELIVRE